MVKQKNSQLSTVNSQLKLKFKIQPYQGGKLMEIVGMHCP